MKCCARCKTNKPLADFYASPSSKDGKGGWCKVCQRQYYIDKRVYTRTLGVCRDHRLPLVTKRACERCRLLARNSAIRKRGMAVAEYERLMALQGGVCATCRRPPTACDRRNPGSPRRLAIDHDHKTGRVRGLLCTNCNTAIGKALDSPEILQRMIEYLERTPPSETCLREVA